MEYLIIIAAVCAAEALIRRAVRKRIDENGTIELPGLPFFLHRYHNRGMAESRLQERPALVKAVGAASLALLTALFLVLLPLKGKKGIKIGLALVIGGGLANLAERFLHGYVTDYIQFKVPFRRIRRLVFNVADLAVFLGGAVMILANLLDREG